jgi:predicted oxidoreductase
LLLSWLIKLPSGVYPVIGTTKVNRINKSLGSLKIDIEISDWFEILEASVGKRVA